MQAQTLAEPLSAFIASPAVVEGSGVVEEYVAFGGSDAGGSAYSCTLVRWELRMVWLPAGGGFLWRRLIEE
jgi:hypothetical protein